MKNGLAAIILVLTAFTVGLAFAQTPTPPPAPDPARITWQYRCEVMPAAMTGAGFTKKWTDALNDAGKEGWELVSFEGSLACFKRPR